MTKLSNEKIDLELGACPNWKRGAEQGLGIEREFKFPAFLDSITFVNQIAALAERMNHHPDILILYNKVKLSIFTHDAGGLTMKDFELARAANELAKT